MKGALESWLGVEGAFSDFIEGVGKKTMDLSWGSDTSETEKAEIKFDKESGTMLVCKVTKREDRPTKGIWLLAAAKHEVSVGITCYKLRAVNAAAREVCADLIKRHGVSLLQKLMALPLFGAPPHPSHTAPQEPLRGCAPPK